MLQATRIETNVEPKVVEYLGDGSYYYNYDIKAKVVTINPIDGEGEPVEETRWDFVQVHLFGKAEYSACVKAVIRAFVDQDAEFDLINSANRVTLGITDASSNTEDYVQYLNLVDEIKANVKRDLK